MKIILLIFLLIFILVLNSCDELGDEKVLSTSNGLSGTHQINPSNLVIKSTNPMLSTPKLTLTPIIDQNQTSVDSNKWIVYTNRELNVSFEYPEFYEYAPSCNLRARILDRADSIRFRGDKVIGLGSSITISMTYPWNNNLNEFINNLLLKNDYAQPVVRDNFEVDGYSGVKIVRVFKKPSSMASDELVLIVHNDRLYIFHMVAMNMISCDGEEIYESDVFDHILSTLKFIK